MHVQCIHSVCFLYQIYTRFVFVTKVCNIIVLAIDIFNHFVATPLWPMVLIIDGRTARKHGVNQVFRFVEGNGLHRQSRQIRFLLLKRHNSPYTCATCFELPSYISTKANTDHFSMFGIHHIYTIS